MSRAVRQQDVERDGQMCSLVRRYRASPTKVSPHAASAIQTYGLYAAGAIAVAVVAVVLGLRWWERRVVANDD